MTTAAALPPRPSPASLVSRLVYAVLFLGAVIWSLGGLDVSWHRITEGIPKAGSIVSQMLLDADWSPDWRKEVLNGIRESLQIAAVGTAIAAVLALPFGVLAARPNRGSSGRSFIAVNGLPIVGKLLNLIRTFPELILAIAFIKAVGPGSFAGVLAIGLHSVGMIGKLYAERIESVDKGALEALSAAGASPLEIFRHGVMPEVLPDFLSFALYRFDLNVRSATVLGLVGAGGVGKLLDLQLNSGNWPAIGVILIGIIVTVGFVDFVSAKIRARLT